jgi:hypothetical protein
MIVILLVIVMHDYNEQNDQHHHEHNHEHNNEHGIMRMMKLITPFLVAVSMR